MSTRSESSSLSCGHSSAETVVLVHGLAGTPLDMWRMSRHLKRLNFDVVNWWYRSLGQRIETHAERLGRDLEALDQQTETTRFHLVTHSMGGIIVRAMLRDARFQKLGRIVMLAPPHRGSHVARVVSPWLGWLTPSLKQLSDENDSFVNQLPNSLLENNVEFAIVEASRDRVIAPGQTHLEGCREMMVSYGQHGIFPTYRRSIELVERFLLHGTFTQS